VIKTALTLEGIADLKRESAAYADLNHPLILGFEGFIPGTATHPAAIVTEFAGNGSLAEHLGHLPSPTKIAKIAVGIALAMRYLHSQPLIHRNLCPETIFLDWDWRVRIGGLCHSVSASTTQTPFSRFRGDFHYTAPECFDDAPTLRSDVFSFGLILYSLLAGRPVFLDGLTPFRVIKLVLFGKRRPVIPESVDPRVRLLIEDCWRHRQDRRPSFEWIVRELNKMEYRIMRGVKSVKVRRFVEEIEARERALGLDISDDISP
jgi:serine/threonine protein kinase